MKLRIAYRDPSWFRRKFVAVIKSEAGHLCTFRCNSADQRSQAVERFVREYLALA